MLIYSFLDLYINKYSKFFCFSQHRTAFTIGLLDMFGFENFKINSFEQLMVNTANEEMQSAFYRNQISYNQQAYQQEGLSYHQVNYKDNRKTVDLLLQVKFSLIFLKK